MKKEHTTKNPLKKLSLQWRLTLIITLLMTVTCVLMYFFISNSAVTGIENLGDYVVKINETDSTPITFNINPNTLFAGLSDQVQATKDLFRTRSRHCRESFLSGFFIVCFSFISDPPSEYSPVRLCSVSDHFPELRAASCEGKKCGHGWNY